MKNDTVRTCMVLFGYCSSLLATFLLKIPNGIQGYVHMGDGFIMPVFQRPIAGSALADIAQDMHILLCCAYN